jgi:hypothetical protein
MNRHRHLLGPLFGVAARAARPRLVLRSMLVGAGVASMLVTATAPARAAERTDTIHRELALEPGVREVVIDNVFGAVRVHAGPAGHVTIDIRRHASAHRDAELDAAFHDVTLEVSSADGRLELVQDGPFRCDERRGGHHSHWGCDWDPDYEVRWQWDVTVPAEVDLAASTVNSGSVEIDGVRGRVRATNVNGPVRLGGLAGEVEASTVNGGVVAEFDRAPANDSKFATVNGKVELGLPRDTAAEIATKTLHGDLYTDFEVQTVPIKTVVERDGASGRLYRFERDTVVRIGSGGVRLDCKTVNGDIVVRAR